MPSRKQDPHGAGADPDPDRDIEVAPLRPLDALKIDVDELEEGPQERAVELPQPWVAEILAETDALAESGGAARLELTLQSDRTVLVRGRIELDYTVPCARCLDAALVDVGAESDELCVTFVPADRLRSWAEFSGAAKDEDEIEPLDPAELDEIGYEGSTLDLRRLISEQIVLAYPIRALCVRGEACLGLCMRCGTNLNQPLDASGSPTIRKGAVPERCPSCGARQDGTDDEAPDTPWKRALAKVVDDEPPKG